MRKVYSAAKKKRLPGAGLETKPEDALMAEYARLRNETFSVEGRSDHVVGITVTLLGLLFLYGVREAHEEVFFILPFLVYALSFYVLKFFHDMCVRRGYLQALEGQINRMSGANVLIWENYLVPRFLLFARCAPGLGFNLVVLLLAVGIVAYSHYVVFISFSRVWFVIQLVLSIGFAVWIGWSSWVSATVSRDSQDLSKSLLAEPPTR
jgi:hypothetical protein